LWGRCPHHLRIGNTICISCICNGLRKIIIEPAIHLATRDDEFPLPKQVLLFEPLHFGKCGPLVGRESSHNSIAPRSRLSLPNNRAADLEKDVTRLRNRLDSLASSEPFRLVNGYQKSGRLNYGSSGRRVLWDGVAGIRQSRRTSRTSAQFDKRAPPLRAIRCGRHSPMSAQATDAHHQRIDRIVEDNTHWLT
jgi:hypothetical protein